MFYANAACLTDVDYQQAQVSPRTQQSLQEESCAMQQWTATAVFCPAAKTAFNVFNVSGSSFVAVGDILQQTRLAIVSLKECPMLLLRMLLLYWSWCWLQWQRFTCSSVVPEGPGLPDRCVSV
jgi:hypothetical protein